MLDEDYGILEVKSKHGENLLECGIAGGIEWSWWC